ncbi:MAG: carbonic anhydrase family protein, partial [Carnobacterium sp.]
LNAGGGLSVPIDLDRLLPENKQFYHYTGSLTTPPTSGPVEWIVFRQQSFMRQGLLQAFKKNIGKTNRPLQPIKNRPIYLSIDE